MANKPTWNSYSYLELQPPIVRISVDVCHFEWEAGVKVGWVDDPVEFPTLDEAQRWIEKRPSTAEDITLTVELVDGSELPPSIFRCPLTAPSPNKSLA